MRHYSETDDAIEEALDALEREFAAFADAAALDALRFDPLDAPTAADMDALARALAE